ncbi:hypothetical protein CK203_007153 [Vitis vinifera]|uniref:Endonuclease/exonuclease/phosphatase domain-containing protein n=1 Tax=Vitis vinifera TaxID=29760 RepID=A0A438KCG1_VITVI|nr:hypothetical protein CK203_007153 [Vitis vinifera]
MGSRFVVESKVFELALIERRGKPQIFIEESKGRVSSWVRVGVESLGFLMEGLNHCIMDEKEDRWEREWKEQGKSYSLLRSLNRAGCFLCLGVTDSERKQYCIYILKGRGGKKGWASMAENLQLLRRSIDRKDNIQEEKVGGNLAVKRTFVEVVKRLICRDKSSVKVKVRRWRRFGEIGEISGNSWGLKGRTMGGLRLRFEHWSPKTGCREEEEQNNEVWVRIFETAKLEELQWARILVKMDGEAKLSMLEIGVEEEVYAFVLWWELRPSVKKIRFDSRKSGKERGMGREVIADWAQESTPMGSMRRACGPSSQRDFMSLKLKGVVNEGVGSEAGPSKRWAFDGNGSMLDGGERLVIWETKEIRKKREKAILSATDKALAEEAMRYDSSLRIEGKRGYRSSHLILYSFDRAPERESYDHSGVLGEINEVGPGVDDNGCWDLVEFTKDSNLARGVEWDSEMTKPQEIRRDKNSANVGGGGEKFRLGKILRLEGLGCGWGSGRFKNVEDEIVWVFTGVYGPFTKKERECLWEEIGVVRGIWDEPWCLGGDFNITLFQRERSRQGRITPTMMRFAYIIGDLGLVDFPLQRGVFTWSGGLNNQSWARLDRFLVSPSWLDQFNGVLQRRLPRPVSDHFPLLLEGGELRRGPSPFRFENMWLKEQEVREGIANAYQQMLSEDSGWKADIVRIQLDHISQQEAENLEILLSENEIHSTLIEMNGDKAPGLDGFTMAFWQSSWNFVKGEILEMFKKFHEQSSFLKNLNNTFLVLILKKWRRETVDFGDFRPISLFGGGAIQIAG